MLRQHLIKIKITDNQHPTRSWKFINQWNKVFYERTKRTRYMVHYYQWNSLPFYFQYNWQYQLAIFQLHQWCLSYSRCDIEPSRVVCFYGCLSNHPRFHEYVLQDYHLHWFLWSRIGWNKPSISCHWENVLN